MPSPDGRPRTTIDTDPWFAVADDEALDYTARLEAYQGLADDYFETERYREFCATTLPHVDEMVLEWIDGPDFRSLLTSTIHQTYPTHEWEHFEAHFGGLLGLWVSDEQARLASQPAVAGG